MMPAGHRPHPASALDANRPPAHSGPPAKNPGIVILSSSRSHVIGDARITRIEEFASDAFASERLLPDWDPAVGRRHAGWMVPGSLSAEQDRVVISVHAWLVETAGRRFLVDTGAGADKERPGKLCIGLQHWALPSFVWMTGACFAI